MRNLLWKPSFRFVPYVGMFLLVLLMWLPFGFKTMGLIEELTITHVFEIGSPLFVITPGSLMDHHRTRPLEVFFHAAAYVLDRDSYFYYNIFQMLLFYGKMLLTYWLVLEFLPGKRVLAFIIGLIYMLYPADTGLFTFRTLTIHGTVFAYLVGVYLMVRYYRSEGGGGIWKLLGAGIGVISSLLQYPIALPTTLITPLCLVYFSWPNRRFWVACLVWYVGIIGVLVYQAWAAAQSIIPAYDDIIVQRINQFDFTGMVEALFIAFQRQVTSWGRAFERLEFADLYWPYLVLGLVVFMSLGWWLLKRQQSEGISEATSWRRMIVLLFSGLAIIAVGMAAYLPIPSHRTQELRIYFISMLGSALVLALGIYLISGLFGRYRARSQLFLAVPFVGLALMNGFFQHQTYANYSLIQQSVMQQIATQAPQVKPDTFIFVVSTTDWLDQEYVFWNSYLLDPALQYLYEMRDISARHCFVTEGPNDNGCDFSKEELIYRSPAPDIEPPGDLSVPYDRVLLFVVDEDNQIRLFSTEEAEQVYHINGYNPQNRIIGSILPRRYFALSSCIPAMACYRDLSGRPSPVFDLPTEGTIGLGWRGFESDGAGGVFQWSVRRTSTVNVHLSDAADLRLEFRVPGWLEDSVIDSLTLSINGTEIPLTYESVMPTGRVYSAVIPGDVLAGQSLRTQLVFNVDHLSPVPGAPDVKLGFQLSWLRIRPAADSS